MKGEFSRESSSPRKSYIGVTTQQGRVALDADADEVTGLLRRYLLAHPEAQDTAEGISRCWLPPAAAGKSAGIQAALAALVAEGLLVEQRGPSGSLYGRKRPIP